MKTFKELTEALPPHLQKFTGGDTVFDRTPSFKAPVQITVPRNAHKEVSTLIKKIRHSTKGSGSGTFLFTDKKEAEKAKKIIQANNIKVLIYK